MLKQKFLIGISLCSLVALSGCVSEQTYVGSDKPVSDRSFDNIEAARTRISLGLNYLRRGDTSQAKYNLERARSFAPNSAEVHSALAYYYQSVGEHKQAEEYFRIAISKDSNYADAYNNYGAFLCQLNRYQEAEQLLLKAISRPGYIRVAESYENLALCKLQQNEFNQAKGYLDSSVSHNATRITSLIMHAGLSYAMGDNPAAKRQLDRIQRLGRVSSRTVLLSYLIAEKSGDREVMRNAEQLLLTLYMDTPEARLLLQGKLESSEFELLRERYKDSLMANIVLPDEAVTLPVPTQSVNNPQLKIVKRKAAKPEQQPKPQPKPQSESQSEQAVVAKIYNNTAGIADSFVQSDAALASAATQAAAVQPSLPVETPAPLPVETQTPAVDMLPTPAEAAATLAATPVVELVDPASTESVDTVSTDTESTNIESADAFSELVTEELVTEELVTEELVTEELVTEELVTEELVTELVVADSAGSVATATADPDNSAEATPYHLVQEAESLYAISVKHNIRLQRLMQWNQLTPEAVIKTGQKIWLGPVSSIELAAEQNPVRPERAVPATTETITGSPYHIVSAGETMFGISYRYNVRLDKFLSWNNLTEQSTLRVGQQLVVVDPASIEP